MQHFEQVCRGAGVKLTHQRMEVFREVALSGDHPDAETIYRRVRARIPTVSLDTVYRALWLLAELGLGKARLQSGLGGRFVGIGITRVL